MRVLHINKSDVKGGAAVAASRIVHALRGMDVEASMLVAEKSGNDASVVSIANSRREKAKVMYYFLQEVAAFLPHEKSKTSRFAFSLARRGFNLHKHPLVLEADLIHLHWFNQGFLSLKGLEKILQLGKPVVWTCMTCGVLQAAVIMPGTVKAIRKVVAIVRSFRIPPTMIYRPCSI
ncbi:hypothetical protein [Geofilum rubicundum]|uniref:Glycosyltransferase, group 1 family protein n=1 Tax=Geofilum rubicundum JCM 15548 TaxID=1236989 RepID=A0A0E9LVW8_9BACT|nr:hypothetical protein [Geofilum rubicundum]GAO29737.1 glycosyltransferase, group 1 family protein [Geofilum rubicundum JCM 15548]